MSNGEKYIILFINNAASKITKQFAALCSRIGLHVPSASLVRSLTTIGRAGKSTIFFKYTNVLM